MKPLKTVLLMSEDTALQVCDLASKARVNLDVTIATDLKSLLGAFLTPKELLLSFGTGVIVPSWILQIPGLHAVNVHAASPSYPGRDPHHFAVYDGVDSFGATMHYMTEIVDEGMIIDVEYFDILSEITPSELLKLANMAGWKIIGRFFERYREHGVPIPITRVTWAKRKTTRKMFLDMCQIEPSMPKEEIERRYKATAMPGYRNLQINLHGYIFRIEGPAE